MTTCDALERLRQGKGCGMTTVGHWDKQCDKNGSSAQSRDVFELGKILKKSVNHRNCALEEDIEGKSKREKSCRNHKFMSDDYVTLCWGRSGTPDEEVSSMSDEVGVLFNELVLDRRNGLPVNG